MAFVHRCGYELRRCGVKERNRWGKRKKRDLRENVWNEREEIRLNEGKKNSNGGGLRC